MASCMPALYRLMAWLSPAFPVGAFSYSSGLEWAVEAGDISDAPSLQRWLDGDDRRRRRLLRRGAVRATRIARPPRATTRCCARVAELAAALAPSRERHLETTARAAPSSRPCAPPGRARRSIGSTASGTARSPIRSRSRVAAAGHGVAARRRAARLSARRRRQPRLGRRAADPARPDRRPARARRARADRRGRRRARRRDALDDLGGAAFRADLAAMRHETQYTRLFRSMTRMSKPHGPLRVGVGGPVGSGKTALMDALCKRLRDALRHRRDHQRHLHQVGRRVPGALRRARAGAHRRRRDRRLPAHRDPRGRLDQPRRGRRHAQALSRSRSDPDRIGRRQPRRHLLARARRPHDLRHRRRGRRQDPVARAAPASPAPICWSSTRSTSRRMSAPRSR